MGRRILRSLRRSQAKPLDVKIEVDDGTVFEVNDGNTVIVTSNEQDGEALGFPDLAPEQCSIATEKSSKRHAYVPPKIWSEEFDSDSDSDAQLNGCWYPGRSSIRRAEKRDRIAHAASKHVDERDETSHFCGVFDCGCGVSVHEDEPEVREMELTEPDLLGENDDDIPISESMAHPTKDNVQTLEEMVVSHVALDSFDEAEGEDSRGDGQEGVELTEDSFWVTAAKTKDVDLDRKTRMERIKKTFKKRRKGRKHRKERTSSASEKLNDSETTASAETTSTNGDSTVISIRHVISDVESVEEGTNDQPEACTSHPVEDCLDDSTETTGTASPPDDPSPVVPSILRKTPTNTRDDPEVPETLSKDDFTKQQDQSSISSQLSSPHSYESLSRNDSDDNAEGETTEAITYEKTTPDDSMLSRVFNAVEVGVGLLSFPEIPQTRMKKKPRTGKRVRFAPDTIFNDADEEYDYSLDYSYSDPEFEESFDEEAYYTTEDEGSEDDDDEAFFDDTPISKRASRDMQDEEYEQCVYDASDTILDFDDEDDDTSDHISGEMSLKSEFEYYYPYASENAGEEEEESVECSTKETSSSYKSTEEMQTVRATSPFEPSMQMLESLQEPSTPDSDDMYSTSDPELEYSDVVVEGEEEDDGDTSYRSFEEMSITGDATSFVSATSFNCDDELPTGTDGLDLDAIAAAATATDIRGGIRRHKKPLKPPMAVKGVDVPKRSETERERSEKEREYSPAASQEGTLLDAIGTTAVPVDRRSGKSRRRKQLRALKSVKGAHTLKCSKAERPEKDPIVPIEDNCGDPENMNNRKDMTPNETLVEKYLNISASLSDHPADAGNQSTVDEDDEKSEESEPPTTPVQIESVDQSIEKTETRESFGEDVDEDSASSIKADERDELVDLLDTPETIQSQQLAKAFSTDDEFTKKSWPALSQTTAPEWDTHSVDEIKVNADGFHPLNESLGELGSNEFSPKNEETIDRVMIPRKRYAKGRISDKKESLQLSLQGFARAKHTSNWANFNNRPFQDLEEAPFDEL